MANSTAATPLVDLNQAGLETLTTLPGIGPMLAARIIRFREEVQPFEETIEVTTVKGISEEMYRRFADRVTVSLPGVEPIGLGNGAGDVPPADDEPPATQVETASLQPGEQVVAKTKVVTATVAAESPRRSEAETALVPQYGPAAEAQPESPPAASLPAPTPSPPPTAVGCWRQLLLMLVGALGGAVLALLLLQSLNGTLDIAAHPRLVELTNEVSALKRQDETVNIELTELRQRLSQFEALSGRLQQAEADLQTVNESLTTLEGQVGTLERDTAQTQALVDQIRAATDRFDDFLSGLRDLLTVTAATPEPTLAPILTVTPPATSIMAETTATPHTPIASPAGQLTPTATRTPRPTRTPTATPTITPTPLPTFTPAPTQEATPTDSDRATTATPSASEAEE